ncbi:hypothetical protein [Nesterenkonia halotolerans]|uniref:Uncharacterized protein n=1 Tax=Nesterenkonia halotolerans TaxID=225325 RepID=A0ABR9J500_9MICC|nr:hypothetical protein [Nesterenkonia halotolerans]MBE1514073.1 hypothetical protein [Nesterenkonia halotolerans]
MHAARKMVLAGGAAAILTGCSAGGPSAEDPGSSGLLSKVRQHIEDEGRDYIVGSSAANAGPAGGRSEWTATEDEVSLFAACKGSPEGGEFLLDGEVLDISCGEEGSVQLIEPNYEPDGEVVITNEGLEQGTEFAIAMASTAEDEN